MNPNDVTPSASGQRLRVTVPADLVRRAYAMWHGHDYWKRYWDARRGV